MVSAAEDCEVHLSIYQLILFLMVKIIFYKEDDIPNPFSYYGQSKLDAEKNS